MRIKENFVLQQIVDDYIVVPVGMEADRMHGIIKLNETGAYLWKKLMQKEQTKEELVKLMKEEYSIDAELAKYDVDCFIQTISGLGCLQ